MFNNWLWVYQQLVFYEENNLGLDPDVEEQMEWLQIDVYILSGRVDKVSSSCLSCNLNDWSV